MTIRPLALPTTCPEWWSLADIAVYFGVAPSTARSWIERGNLTVKRAPGSSGRYLIYGPSLVDWIKRDRPTMLKSARPTSERARTPAATPPVDSYAAELRAIGLMFARWRQPYPVAWPSWVGPFPTLQEEHP